MDLDTPSSGLVQELNSTNGSSTDTKSASYIRILDKLLKSSSTQELEPNLKAYVVSLIGGDEQIPGLLQASEYLSIIALRPLLDDLILKIKGSQVPIDVLISTTRTAVQLLRPRVTSFVQQDTKFKELLANAYESQQDFTASARALQSIDLDSTQRNVTDTERAQIWVRIARCYLEEDNATDAATYINRVKNVRDNVTDRTVRLQFQMGQARIYDSQRQFLDASAAYHTISFESLVDEDDRLQTLSAAIICAVLAPAGPQRARMLGRLYKDDRAAQVEEFPILEKIFLDRLLAPEEVAAFAAKLAPHQLAKTGDGSTVLDRAILEHNLLSASRLYRNIAIDNLGNLLGIGGERAEQYAAQMIEQKRLAGHIDQIDRVIFFDGETTLEKPTASGQVNTFGKTELRRWDAAVLGIAEEIEKVSTMIQNAFPEFYTANMAF